ncbi:MAG: prepilin-type N-terminal cleavage/methylation domain-containing protein [Dehalococcoidia bacterium]|nr:prepilin-type N-terminal cleavage/methylation domain-containing protein [Dehalococcoidia bacterium]
MRREASRRAEGLGFTLIELLVVLSILAVLAAVVIPMVTGVSTTARVTVQAADINEVQNAVTRFTSESGDWPTKAGSGWAARSLPGTAYTVSGGSYVFIVGSIAGIDAGGAFGAKTFVPDYISMPKHYADAQITVNPGSQQTFTINKQGSTATVVLSNPTGVSQAFDAWGIDSRGGVWVFVNKEAY